MSKKETIESEEKEEIREVIVEKKSGFNFVEVIVIIVISLLFGIFLGSAITYAKEGVSPVSSKEVPKELSEFVSTYEDIIENYYDKVDKEELISAGMKGMIDYLNDPYASFMDIEQTEDFNEQVEGHYVGIGVEILAGENQVSISKVFANGPADRAGLKVGDVISSIDGVSVEGLSLSVISDKVKGKENSTVTIGYLRSGEQRETVVTRKDVDITSVTGEVIEFQGKKIGLLKVDIFASNTAKQFRTQLLKLEKKNMDSLIIDVRDNPGGHLTQVSEMASLFLDKSNVIYQLETKGKTQKIYSLTKEKRTYPIVVLTNHSSASASEILAAALKESYGASIIGTNSYGKGTVQEAYSLKSGATIKYTTQKWLTPKGTWIHEKGVEPTIKVEQGEEYYKNPTRENDLQLQAAFLELAKK